MNSEQKRSTRINSLYNKADNGNFTVKGKLNYLLIVAAAMGIGVSKPTAESYADTVISRLKKTGRIRA